MSSAMLHGLGDCTPKLHCGCITPAVRDRYYRRVIQLLIDRLEVDGYTKQAYAMTAILETIPEV